MKTINSLFLALAALFIWSACEDDADKYYLSSLTENELIASTNNIVLTEDIAQKNVLSLAWTDRTLAINNPDFKPTNLLKTSIQVALNEDFSGTIVESTETSLSKTYNGAELNIVTNNLGVEANVATKFYFRLKGTTGNNIEPAYSNVEVINITPYELDMRFASMLDQNGTDTGMSLFSVNTDGVYKGFVGVNAWYNFLIKEANGTIWRNDNETGMPFLLTTAGDWKCWFPGVGGCYYITFDTNNKQWNGIQIPTLNVSGDIDATMEFNQTSRKWTATFNANAAGSMTIQISGTGKLYDHTCANPNDNGGYDIDDTKAKDTPMAFSGSSTALNLGETAGDITVNVPQAGECTLSIDLSNPQQWTVSVEEGSIEPEPEPEEGQYLYLPGIGQGSDWTYDHKIEVYYKEEQKYAGIVDVNSQYGNYAMTLFSLGDAWDTDKMYTIANDDSESTAEAGTLVNGQAKNIPAPAAGLYLFDVSLKELTYKTYAVGNNIYCYYGIEGDNNLYPIATTGTTGEYSGTITLSQDSNWGIKFYIKDDWTGAYGGSNGKLYYNSNDGIPLTAGTYTITVNLIDGTYSASNK